ncbi:MAG: energy transducer TonB, partial [Paludibacteraceae bacterium]|nr:energy transducer TonB [Paludibacteraceae bacterium]
KVPENGAELKLRPLIKTDEYRSKDRKRNLKQDILFNKAYPIVKEMKQSVKVKVRFIINEDHSLSDFKIVSTDDERFNEAAMETLKRMDGWQCRQVNGRVVKTRKTVTISYTKEELMRVIELMDK